MPPQIKRGRRGHRPAPKHLYRGEQLSLVRNPSFTESGATFDETRFFRYTLHRVWDEMNPRRIAFIGLNPSTADEVDEDPTVRRCIGFARRWGFGGFFMLNLFAFRSTDPKLLYRDENYVGEFEHLIDTILEKSKDWEKEKPLDEFYTKIAFPVGADNDTKIIETADKCEMLILAWGTHGTLKQRGRELLAKLQRHCPKKLFCLGRNKDGSPKHPLYIKGDTKPVPV